MRDFLLQFFIDNPAFFSLLMLTLISAITLLILLLWVGYKDAVKLAVLSFVVAGLLGVALLVSGPLPTQYLSQLTSPCFNTKARDYLTKSNTQLTLLEASKIRQGCLVEESIWPDVADPLAEPLTEGVVEQLSVL